MGHKVNPLIFRLGSSNNWSFNLKEKKNWVTSYLIYQLVSNQFMRYTTPHFDRVYTRNERHSTGLVKMKGEKQIMPSNFLKKSMLFSHILVGSFNYNLNISCFFYDYRAVNFRNRSKNFKRYSQLYSNIYLRWRVKPRTQPFLTRAVIRQSKGGRRTFRAFSKFVPLVWLANLNLIGIAQESSNYKIWLLNKVWLRLLGQNFTKKRKLFFLNVWTTLLANVIPVLKTVGLIPLANRLYLILVRINLFNFDKKLNNSLFFVQLFRMRYFILKAVSKSVGENLRSLLPNKTNKIGLKYYAIREKKMTAALLTNLIIVKLGQYFRINSILYPLTRWISRHKNVLGYRIIISGRLTRRERASHMIKSGRSMPLSSYRHRIDYNQDVKIMKFGMVGIKVYLFLRNQTRNSYYFFKFIV